MRRRNHKSQESTSSTPANEQQDTSPTPPYSQVTGFETIISIESEERRLLEMRLLHQFTTVTVSKDFLSLHDDNVSELWTTTAPNLAFDFPFLMNTILSVAALHLAKIQPERQDMAAVHRTYFNTAISQHRHAVRDLSSQNAEAVCVSAVLIALPAFILLQNTEVGTYSAPFQLFYLLAGNVPLFLKALPLCGQNSKILCILTARPNMPEFIKEAAKEVYRQPFSQFINWRAPSEEIDQDSQVAYDFALSFIGCILVNIERGEDPSVIRRILYSFPTLLPPIFVTRLTEGNPRALIILAYFFSLAKAVDNVWWMRGIAEREVFGIQTLLPEHWQWAMAWPLQKLASYAVSSILQI